MEIVPYKCVRCGHHLGRHHPITGCAGNQIFRHRHATGQWEATGEWEGCGCMTFVKHECIYPLPPTAEQRYEMLRASDR